MTVYVERDKGYCSEKYEDVEKVYTRHYKHDMTIRMIRAWEIIELYNVRNLIIE